jgi:hypothetical protein
MNHQLTSLHTLKALSWLLCRLQWGASVLHDWVSINVRGIMSIIRTIRYLNCIGCLAQRFLVPFLGSFFIFHPSCTFCSDALVWPSCLTLVATQTSKNLTPRFLGYCHWLATRHESYCKPYIYFISWLLRRFTTVISLIIQFYDINQIIANHQYMHHYYA